MADIQKYVAPTHPFRTEQALTILGEAEQGRLLALAHTVEGFVERVAQISVDSDDDAIRLNDLLAGAKIASDRLEADRSERKKPVLAEGRAIDGLYRPTSDAFTRIKDIARQKLSAHLQRKQEENARRLAEAAKLQEEARLKQEEALRAAQDATSKKDKAAAEVLVDAAQTALIEAHRAVPMEAVVSGIRSEMANSSLGFKKVAKLADVKLVPRDYLEAAVLLEPKLVERVALSAFREGVNQIPGIDLMEEQVLRTRVGLQ